MAHRPQFIVIIIVIVSIVAITTIRTMGIITIVIAIEAIVIRMRIKIAVIIITLLVVLIVTPIISSPECGFRMWRMSRLVSPVFGAPTYKGFFVSCRRIIRIIIVVVIQSSLSFSFLSG